MRKSAQLAVLLIVSVATVFAQTQSTPAPASSGLKSIEWMTGGVWTAEAKGPNGAITHIENRIRWADNKQAITFETRFNNDPHYFGMYAWDPAKNAIAFFYTSSEGELTIGTAKMDGETLTQEFTITHTSGKQDNLRSVIKRDGNDAYDWRVEGQREGKWAQLIALRYTRKSE